MAKAPAKKEVAVEVVDLKRGTAMFCIKGNTPFIFNAMSAKAKRELLMPRGRLSAAERKSHLKHDPLAEFRDSVYTRADKGSSRLVFPASAFKRAIADAALDMPTGVSKAACGRLIWVEGDMVPIWGVPQMLMSVVRSADAAKTPDIRTRAIVPKWATMVSVQYTEPVMTAKAVTTLMGAAGMIIGVGDWRQQKGAGSFGQFSVTHPDDQEWNELMEAGNQDAQDKAMDDPMAYDEETEKLFHWFQDELGRRGRTATKVVDATAQEARV